ncbi:hypothetical protein BH10PSE16_BH10PSE16_28790 [soil metagenome]
MKTLLLLFTAAGLTGCAVYPTPSYDPAYGGGVAPPPYGVEPPVYIYGGGVYRSEGYPRAYPPGFYNRPPPRPHPPTIVRPHRPPPPPLVVVPQRPPHPPGAQAPPHPGRGDRQPGGSPHRPDRDHHGDGAPARPDRSRDRDGDGIPNRRDSRPDASSGR